MLPINFGLTIGTFWGRFHYVSDVFVGIAIAIVAYILVDKKHASWIKNEYKELSNKEPKAKVVS